jgi:hypothetical protein
MKKTILSILIFTFLLSSNISMAQLNMAGVSASFANINDSTSDLNTNLIGLNGFIEFPVQGISTRIEYSYFVPTNSNKDNLPKIEQLSFAHLYLGKVLRQGQRFQIPLYIGAGNYNSKGDIKFDNWDIGAKIGGRMYVTPRVAIFADVSAHYILATDFTYTNKMGIEETSNLKPITTHINFGVTFSYLKSD